MWLEVLVQTLDTLANFHSFDTLGYVREPTKFEGLLPRLMPRSNLKFCRFSITDLPKDTQSGCRSPEPKIDKSDKIPLWNMNIPTWNDILCCLQNAIRCLFKIAKKIIAFFRNSVPCNFKRGMYWPQFYWKYETTGRSYVFWKKKTRSDNATPPWPEDKIH